MSSSKSSFMLKYGRKKVFSQWQTSSPHSVGSSSAAIPHVFATATVSNTAEVVKNWEKIKQQEKKTASSPEQYAASLPALLLATTPPRRELPGSASIGKTRTAPGKKSAKNPKKMGQGCSRKTNSKSRLNTVTCSSPVSISLEPWKYLLRKPSTRQTGNFQHRFQCLEDYSNLNISLFLPLPGGNGPTVGRNKTVRKGLAEAPMVKRFLQYLRSC